MAVEQFEGANEPRNEETPEHLGASALDGVVEQPSGYALYANLARELGAPGADQPRVVSLSRSPVDNGRISTYSNGGTSWSTPGSL